jgi:O-glycosyl hydrolase
MQTLPPAEMNALFGTIGSDLGLSLLRVRIDPSFTAGGASNWGAELGNAQEAIAAGSNVNVIATPWTPPAVYKTNNSTVMGSLNPSSYGAYAAYLESFVTYMASGGVNLYGISMQNEPDANVTYESCAWTGAQMDTWVANNASVLTTRLIMPESENFNTSYSDPALADPNAVGHIAIVAGHLYGSSPSYYANAENAQKDVWMTEHYLTPAGAQPTIADALAAAEEVHNSMTADYNAYLWWWIADSIPNIGVINYGLIDANGSLTYYGYALGQFARFVRPGYVRVTATAEPAAGIYISAYAGDGHYVLVAINSTSAAEGAPLVFQTAWSRS